MAYPSYLDIGHRGEDNLIWWMRYEDDDIRVGKPGRSHMTTTGYAREGEVYGRIDSNRRMISVAGGPEERRLYAASLLDEDYPGFHIHLYDEDVYRIGSYQKQNPVFELFHGTGPGGFAEQEGRRDGFSGKPAKGRHLFATSDIDMAFRYGRHVWRIVVDVDEDEILDFPRSDEPLTPRQWIELIGLDERGFTKMPDHFKEYFEHHPRLKLSYAQLVGVEGDGREYSPGNERKLISAIKTSRPGIKMIRYAELFHDVSFEVYEYETFIIADQSIIESAERAL